MINLFEYLFYLTACSTLGLCNFQSGVFCPSVLLTSFQGLDLISGGHLLSCVWHEFLPHIWLCPELFPFVLLLRFYEFTAPSFLLNLLSISFSVLFILCEQSCVKPFLTCVGHPLMINSCPCHFYSGSNKSVVRRCFCPTLWTCTVQDLLVLLIQDNVISLTVYWDSLLCYQVCSFLQPVCNVFCRVLEGAFCNDFTIFFTEFQQVDTILIFSASWSLPNTTFSCSSYFAVEIPCQHTNGW